MLRSRIVANSVRLYMTGDKQSAPTPLLHSNNLGVLKKPFDFRRFLLSIPTTRTKASHPQVYPETSNTNKEADKVPPSQPAITTFFRAELTDKTVKVKPREPDIYDGTTDVHFWIMGITDQLPERRIEGDASQLCSPSSHSNELQTAKTTNIITNNIATPTSNERKGGPSSLLFDSEEDINKGEEEDSSSTKVPGSRCLGVHLKRLLFSPKPKTTDPILIWQYLKVLESVGDQESIQKLNGYTDSVTGCLHTTRQTFNSTKAVTRGLGE
ncbi:hypothetical protein HL42_4672 [Trichophyton rubrum]|nr:hypothetical protein HL42_4672 [Trichophyton rubrum]